MKRFLVFLSLLVQSICFSKEIALTFDDAPVSSSLHFESLERTQKLIQKMEELKIPSVMIFANPCKGRDQQAVQEQLLLYKAKGHVIGNHTCSHPRLDAVGFETYSKDAQEADVKLQPLMEGQKFFRYPYLNEGTDENLRNRMRDWLVRHHYRNASVSIDNDDTVVAQYLNKAKKLGKKIDYRKVQELYLKHMLSAVEYYEAMAIKQLGRSPKHVLLMHEIDSSLLFLEPLVKELRKRGWKIISASEAYTDPLYDLKPVNTYAGNGILAQLAYEKTGQKLPKTYYKWEDLERDLNLLLGLKK